jgi:hypothetical protein
MRRGCSTRLIGRRWAAVSGHWVSQKYFANIVRKLLKIRNRVRLGFDQSDPVSRQATLPLDIEIDGRNKVVASVRNIGGNQCIAKE